jgi:hypothetical protein
MAFSSILAPPPTAVVVGRIFKASATSVGTPWMWALGSHADARL